MDELEKWETQFRKGLTGVLVMLAVAQQKQTYGYQLLMFLQAQGLDIGEGTLYPLLNRLHRNRWLQSNWSVPSAAGGYPKRIYQLSDLGHKLLPLLEARIDYYQSVIHQLRSL